MGWKEIGKLICERRSEKRFHQIEMAKLLGKSPATYWKYEQGKIAIPFMTMKRICDILEIDIKSL